MSDEMGVKGKEEKGKTGKAADLNLMCVASGRAIERKGKFTLLFARLFVRYPYYDAGY